MTLTTGGLLLIVFIMSVGTMENEQAGAQRAPRQEETTTPEPPHAELTERRLEDYALCREKLDPLAIRAVLEAHSRIVKGIEASGRLSLAITNRLAATSLPVYGDALVEWLLDEGRGEFEVELGDPFMEASSSPPQAGPAAAELEAEAESCGLGSAAAYWETTRRIASVLDYRPVDERFRRPGSRSADVERAMRRRANRFEDLSVTTSARDIGVERALLDRFLSRLGLCTTSAPTTTKGSRFVCWKGTAIAGAPCAADLNLASTGYRERDGICYAPSGRPDGPRLRTVCPMNNEIRRDLPTYPVLCESGVWHQVLSCSKDADCHPEWYAYPRSCKQRVCYAGEKGKELPIPR
jgi:hypothetical protein